MVMKPTLFSGAPTRRMLARLFAYPWMFSAGLLPKISPDYGAVGMYGAGVTPL